MELAAEAACSFLRLSATLIPAWHAIERKLARSGIDPHVAARSEPSTAQAAAGFLSSTQPLTHGGCAWESCVAGQTAHGEGPGPQLQLPAPPQPHWLQHEPLRLGSGAAWPARHSVPVSWSASYCHMETAARSMPPWSHWCSCWGGYLVRLAVRAADGLPVVPCLMVMTAPGRGAPGIPAGSASGLCQGSCAVCCWEGAGLILRTHKRHGLPHGRPAKRQRCLLYAPGRGPLS